MTADGNTKKELSEHGRKRFLSGNNFTMHNGIFSLYKKDGEALIGKYKFNGQNNITISDFSDNKFNGTWIKK